jgi:diadenosine tetraphosphate (Ap4A) HIT family hydrolase
MNDGREPKCPLCFEERRAADPGPGRERVHVTDYWRVVAHKSGLPGWLLLLPHRHVGSLDELTAAEAAELGPLLAQATAAQKSGLGALRSYVLMFAEATRHVHFSIAPRMPDLPRERFGPGITAYNSADQPLTDAELDEIALCLSKAWSSKV